MDQGDRTAGDGQPQGRRRTQPLDYPFQLLFDTLGGGVMNLIGIALPSLVLVFLLSGAAVPLAFFPKGIQGVLEWLPFQAVYNTPVRLLIDPTLGPVEIIEDFSYNGGRYRRGKVS